MKKIDGKEKSLRELLQSKKYTLYYYQREYRWQRKHIQEKFDDFELNGGEVHKWLRDNHAKLNLDTSADYERFLKNFLHFAKIYRKIKHAEKFFLMSLNISTAMHN